MSKIVLKEYRNEKIHSRSSDHESKDFDFCDTNVINLEEREEKRCFEFNNFHFNKTYYTLSLSKDKSSFKDVIGNTPYTFAIAFNDAQAVFEKDFNECKINFEKGLLSSYGRAKTIKEKNGEDYSLYSLTNNSIEFYLTEFNIVDEEKELASGKIEIVFKYYVCPICGEKLSKYYFNESKTKTLGAYVFNDEKNIKFTTIKKQIAVHKNLSWVRYYKDMIVYKKETCKIYKVENFNFASSKYLRRKFPKRVKDVTYCCAPILKGEYYNDEMLNSGYKVINKMILEHLEQKNGIQFEYAKSDVTLLRNSEEFSYIYLLQMKNKYNINNIYLANLLLTARRDSDRNLERIFKGLTEKEMLKILKINKKRLQEIDKNKMYDTVITFFDLLEDVNSMNELLAYDRRYNVDRASAKYKDFLYQYRKNNTERRFLNQIKAVDSNYTLNDTARLFRQIKEKLKDYEVDYSRSISDLHDIFSKDYNKLKHENKKIPGNKAINKMFKDAVCNDITYRPAKDTNELIRIGSFMDICVGGYGERAVRKDCIIVAGYDSNDKPVTCIELDNRNGKFYLCQVKKRKNRTPKQYECDYLNELFIGQDVVINCTDIADNRYNALQENDNEILQERNDLTYSRNIPEEVRLEIMAQNNDLENNVAI